MDAQIIAFLILLPITLVFVYAGIHEFRRYKSEGKANYGLVFDEDPFDPEDFDPNDYNDPEVKTGTDERKS